MPVKSEPIKKVGAALELTSAAKSLTPSATLAINEAVGHKRACGEEIIHLGFGQASFPLHPKLRQAFVRAADKTEYAPVMGTASLRSAIAQYLGRTRGLQLTAKQIAVAPGSKPLIYALLCILEGDLLLPRPSWVSYVPQAKLAGKEVTWVEPDPRDRYRVTPQALSLAVSSARKRRGNPRLLLLNSPNNPTGCMLDEKDVKDIAEWANENGITILSDEIYAELAHGWRKHVSPALYYPEGCIVTGGLSKAFSAGGWRLGYAAFPGGDLGQRLGTALQSIASEIWSSATTPVQEAALAAFSNDASVNAYVEDSAALHGYVADRLHRALTDMGVLCPRPAGAFYLYPDFDPWRGNLAKHGIRTSEELALYLLGKWNIATLPGTEFGDHPHNLTLRVATSLLFNSFSNSSSNCSSGSSSNSSSNCYADQASDAAFANRWDKLFTDPQSLRNQIETNSLSCPGLDEAISRFQQVIFTLS